MRATAAHGSGIIVASLVPENAVGSRSSIAVLAVAALAACGGAAGGGDASDRPDWGTILGDAGPDTSAPDAAQDADGPAEAAPDAAGDPAAEGTDAGADPAIEDGPSGDETSVADPAADEATAPDLPPSDAGHEVAVGACAPDDPSCWCENDSHCNPSYNVPCLPNVCDPASHHCGLDAQKLDGKACDDGQSCTAGDACLGGQCKSGAWTCECKADADCDDDNPCTDDSCGGNACKHVNNGAPCDDGKECTSGDACVGGKCVPGVKVCACETDADCDDHNVCTTESCVVATHTCSHGTQDGPCDDGNSCTGPDTCAGGTCVPGPKTCECQGPADCDDGNSCTDDSCVAYKCQHAKSTKPCDDGDPSTVGDHCYDGGCVPGVKCGDGTCDKPTETCASCQEDCGACPLHETDCADGWDGDGDGKVDCQDPDCAPIPPCTPDVCTKVDADVTCGYYKSSTSVSGNDIKGKGGLCDMDMDDSDRIYRFTTDVARSVMPKVLNGGNDMFRIFVLAGACNPASCKNDTWGSGSAYLTFYAEPGIAYYIVVESNQTTSHTFKVDCP